MYVPVVSVSSGPVETLGQVIVDIALTYEPSFPLPRDQHIV